MKTVVVDELKAKNVNISQIIERPPGDLKPWPGNPRTHSDQQLVKLKASIRTFGFTAPVLVDEAGVILSGHGRVQAAKELGLATIPTRVSERPVAGEEAGLCHRRQQDRPALRMGQEPAQGRAGHSHSGRFRDRNDRL